MGIFQRVGREGWYIRYSYRGRKYREKGGRTQKEALAAYCKRKTEITENKFFDIKREEKLTLSEWASEYMELHSKPNKKSWKSDENSLKALLPVFGDSYLYEITPDRIEKFKIERRKEVAPATVNRELACLRVMFSKAIDYKKVADNPVRKVKLFREDNKRLRFLSQEEIKQLLENSPKWLELVIVVALNTGMRKEELAGLKWTDIDFERKYIQLLETKNGSKRYVALSESAEKAIRMIEAHPSSPYIFCDENGEKRNFRFAYMKALKKAGISGATFHTLRHSAASHWRMSGVDIPTIGELLGHKSLEMTKRYAHLSQSFKLSAVNTLSNMMGTVWAPESKTASQR